MSDDLNKNQEPQMSMTFFLAQLSESFRELRKDVNEIKNNMLTKEEFAGYKVDVKAQLDELKLSQKELKSKIGTLDDEVSLNSLHRKSSVWLFRGILGGLASIIIPMIIFISQYEWTEWHKVPAPTTYISAPSATSVNQTKISTP